MSEPPKKAKSAYGFFQSEFYATKKAESEGEGAFDLAAAQKEIGAVPAW